MATSLPVVTVRKSDGGWTAICGSCGWAMWHFLRPAVDLDAADHRRSHATWKGPR